MFICRLCLNVLEKQAITRLYQTKKLDIFCVFMYLIDSITNQIVPKHKEQSRSLTCQPSLI